MITKLMALLTIIDLNIIDLKKTKNGYLLHYSAPTGGQLLSMQVKDYLSFHFSISEAYLRHTNDSEPMESKIELTEKKDLLKKSSISENKVSIFYFMRQDAKTITHIDAKNLNNLCVDLDLFYHLFYGDPDDHCLINQKVVSRRNWKIDFLEAFMLYRKENHKEAIKVSDLEAKTFVRYFEKKATIETLNLFKFLNKVYSIKVMDINATGIVYRFDDEYPFKRETLVELDKLGAVLYNREAVEASF